MTRGQPARRTGLRAVRPTAQLLRDTSEGVTSEYSEINCEVSVKKTKYSFLGTSFLQWERASPGGHCFQSFLKGWLCPSHLQDQTAWLRRERVARRPPRPGSLSPLVSKIQVLLKHGPRGLVSLSPVCDSPVSLALLIPSHSLQMLALSSQEPPLCAPALPVDCSLPAQHAAAWPPGPCPNVAQAFPPHHTGHQLTGCHTLDASLAAAV